MKMLKIKILIVKNLYRLRLCKH